MKFTCLGFYNDKLARALILKSAMTCCVQAVGSRVLAEILCPPTRPAVQMYKAITQEARERKLVRTSCVVPPVALSGRRAQALSRTHLQEQVLACWP